MPDDKVKIYVWADGTWISEEDTEGDLDWYIFSSGKSDDYTAYDISSELEPEDIDELISLEALPGMLPEPQEGIIKIEDMGKIPIPEGAVVLVHHSKDIEYNAVTMLEDRLIVNAPDIFIEIITPKVKKDD